MNIIEAVKYMKSNVDVRIVKEEWREGVCFFKYYLRYNEFYNCVEMIDSYSIWDLSNDESYISDYNFDLEDILYNNWMVYED
ncbi:hypothetical protein [Clostridium sp.]|uniref:hypothetical protein n=1 Tax=Clostridium sp. TaxID=1506 RepID=UPI003F41219B